MRGDFFRAGISKAGYHDLKFDPSEWDGTGAKAGDNGDDWIVDFRPKKLHG
jgi:hypothetical protein